MNVIIVFGFTLAALFMLAFYTRRRFGVLGLALAAGALLSDLWAVQLTPIVKSTGLEIISPPLLTIVSVGLVLLPAVLLLASGPAYHNKKEQFLGAFLFSTLALALLVEPLGTGLVLQGDSRQIYEWLIEYRVWIVTTGLIIALIDLMFAKSRKLDKHKD